MLLFSGPCNSLPNFPTFHFHAESSAQYLMFIFSAQCNLLPHVPIFHPHAETGAQYLIFIFSGRCNLSPDFPICHLHATSSAQYLISILSEQHNSITPFINVAPPCSIRSPIFDMHFFSTQHNSPISLIHQYHPSNPNMPNAESAPQYFLYISWGVTSFYDSIHQPPFKCATYISS